MLCGEYMIEANQQPRADFFNGIISLRKREGNHASTTIIMLLVVASVVFCLTENRDARPLYATAPVTLGSLSVTVTATGTIFPTRQIDISSELSGVVRSVNADYNQPVKAGQLLAEIDTVTFAANVDRSRASVEAAKARITQAEAAAEEREKNYNRQRALNLGGISAENSFEAAKAEHRRAAAIVQIAKAELKAAEAELSQNEVYLSKTSLFSPIDGVVLRRSVEPGQTVIAALQAQTLFTLAENLSTVEPRVDIDEADIGKVHVGQSAFFTVEAYPGRKFAARIEQVRYASETVNNVVSYKAILRADNPELLLRPGMTVTAEIVVEQDNDVLLIPNTAARFVLPDAKTEKSGGLTLFQMPRLQASSFAVDPKSSERRIYILQDGKPTPIDIIVGASDRRLTHVLKGLQPGTPVITGMNQSEDGR